MSRFRFGWLPATASTLAGVVVSLTLGGCPVQQTPTITNPDNEPNTNTPPVTTPDTGLPRPVPPPPTPNEDTTNSSGGGSGSGSGGSGSGGSGGGGSATGSAILIVQSPIDTVKVRPGAIVNLTFDLQDATGAVNSVELVLARDDNADNQPDGDPVLTKSLTIKTGANNVPFDTSTAAGLLTNGFGRFKIGVRINTVDAKSDRKYSTGSLTLDSVPPTAAWITPQTDTLTNRVNFPISINVTDNSVDSVRVLLDPDTDPSNGNEATLVTPTNVPAGNSTLNVSPGLLGFPAGTYNMYVVVSDGIAPDAKFYAERAAGDPIRIRVTDRLVGEFDLNTLTNSTQGAILQGFNFNDLGGSSISRVPDMNSDGRDELLIGSRFGKAYLIAKDGIGFGEAYMIYGQTQRLKGIQRLNSVGQSIPGLIFPGIRTPRTAGIAAPNISTKWTAGLSDITVVPDMDGDNLPELVFSFPRVESINLGEGNATIQHPELAPDLGGMGALEYNAFYGLVPVWHPNESQFTRGGIVIVSSHNALLKDQNVLNRKSDRVFDLHEAGQLFSGMSRPSLVPYVAASLTRPARTPLPPMNAFIVCADCDLLPPDFEPGDLGGPGTEDDTPGECGDDGCGLVAEPPADPNRGNIHDGRETTIERWFVLWDVVFNNQGPGGFHQSWTLPPANPPLANPGAFPFTPPNFPFGFYPNRWGFLSCPQAGMQGESADGCEITNEWLSWFPTLPGTILAGTPSWATSGNPSQTPNNCYANNVSGPFIVPPETPCLPAPAQFCPSPGINVAAGGTSAWTGFYAPGVIPIVGTSTGESFPTPIGARIMGQAVEDRFGTTVGADGTWLYISAPGRTANGAPYTTDVPSLSGSRNASGVVYQLRTDARLSPGGVTRTQLWAELATQTILDPNLQNPDPNDPNSFITVVPGWPFVDAEDVDRADYTMPFPHQYIIESIGSIRGNPAIGRSQKAFREEGDTCPLPYDPIAGEEEAAANAIGAYTPYPVGTAGYYVDRTPQIVGPHANSRIEFVRGLGDVNGDGVRDFAVGSAAITSDLSGNGTPVGAVFIVYGRPTGVEGDYLLEQLALNLGDPQRLNGVLIKGGSANETLARVFADAGDVNGDGFADVIIGNEGFGATAPGNGKGEAIILLGSPTLISPGPADAGGVPGGGWTPATIPANRVIRFTGANQGDLAGANVSSAGDVDRDGFSDVLISAPGADGGKGAVYLVYGGAQLTQNVALKDLSTQNVATTYVRFTGRAAQNFLGAGAKVIGGTHPTQAGLNITANSQGISNLGDIDGDGNDDFAISAMLADPEGKTDAGEVYVIYGRRGP